MFRKFLTSFVCIISFFSLAEEGQEPQLPPLDPSYHGIHPMALVNKGSTIFAYYLTGYEKPHDLQLVYKLKVKDVALVQLVRDSDLVTIKPEALNIQQLMRGDKMMITADVYMGHYKNGGIVTYEAMPLEFDELLYARELSEISDSSNNREYEVVSYNSQTDRLFIHHVQKAPSYAHLLHIDLTASCRNKFRTSSAIPKEKEVLYKFINCGTITPLYYDTEAYKVSEEVAF